MPFGDSITKIICYFWLLANWDICSAYPCPQYSVRMERSGAIYVQEFHQVLQTRQASAEGLAQGMRAPSIKLLSLILTQ